MELRGEKLSCYLHSIQSVGLWKCLYDHLLANKAYFSAITVKNIYESFTHKMATNASWHRHYATVTLCITRWLCVCSLSLMRAFLAAGGTRKHGTEPADPNCGQRKRREKYFLRYACILEINYGNLAHEKPLSIGRFTYKGPVIFKIRAF